MLLLLHAVVHGAVAGEQDALGLLHRPQRMSGISDFGLTYVVVRLWGVPNPGTRTFHLPSEVFQPWYTLGCPRPARASVIQNG